MATLVGMEAETEVGTEVAMERAALEIKQDISAISAVFLYNFDYLLTARVIGLRTFPQTLFNDATQ